MPIDRKNDHSLGVFFYTAEEQRRRVRKNSQD